MTHSRQLWSDLILIGLVSFAIAFDFSSIDVAMPTIRDHLHFSTELAPWIMSGYTLTFGGFLLLGGRLGDLYGRRRIMLTGAFIFTLMSILGTCSPDPVTFVISRVVKGGGAALLVPNIFALINARFAEGSERHKAFGFFGFFAEAAFATGNFLGGVLTNYSWRETVGVSALLGLLILAWSWLTLPQEPSRAPKGGLDVIGAVLSVLAFGLLLSGLSDCLEIGWTSPRAVIQVVVSLACFGAFWWRIHHHPSPILPPDLLRNRNVLGAAAIIFILMGSGQGTFFQIILFLQDILKYSPKATGMALFPLIAVSLTASFFANKILDAFGFRMTIVGGMLGMTASILWLQTLGVGTTYWLGFVPIMTLWSFSFPIAAIAVRIPAGLGVAEMKQGIAYGIHYAGEQLGMSFGIAVLWAISVAAAHSRPEQGLQAAVYGFRISSAVSAIFAVTTVFIAIYLLKGVEVERKALLTSPDPCPS